MTTRNRDLSFDAKTKNDCIQIIKHALLEDVGSFDLALAIDCTTHSIVTTNAPASAALVSRDEGTVCGLQVCKLAIENFAPEIRLEIQVDDGQDIEPQQTLAVLSGSARELLILERTCLNFLCRLSGISTLTNQFVSKVKGTQAKILDTRKTTPGWRRLEKYAVICGGGENHRMGLSDAILIKDNHLAMMTKVVGDESQGITRALKMARDWVSENALKLPKGAATVVQIEVDTLDQHAVALKSRPDIILLDNMSITELANAVRMRDEMTPGVLLEASGGVDLLTVESIAKTGVDRISIGALTHSAPNFDIGLDWINV